MEWNFWNGSSLSDVHRIHHLAPKTNLKQDISLENHFKNLFIKLRFFQSRYKKWGSARVRIHDAKILPPAATQVSVILYA